MTSGRPLVVLMSAPIAAGKTTVASALERAGFVRLSVDAVAHERGWTGVITAQQEQELDAVLRAQLGALLRDGRDVVLDFSFSTRAARDQYRRLVRPLGTPVVVHVRTPHDVALERLARRADRHADDVSMSLEDAARYQQQFEVPTRGEGPLVTCDGTQPIEADALVQALRQRASGVPEG